MTRERFISKDFRAGTWAVIDQANAIIEDYQARGFVLTLRQLYYQFVARDLMPNSTQSYNRLGSIINDARLAGELDWNAIEDRTRNLEANPHWRSPADIIRAAAQSFRLDLWADQFWRPEVWVEKEALVGVFAGVCERLDVPYFACRGYASQSEVWRAARRFRNYARRGQKPIVFHFGDHDPSGIDMTRDNRDRLELLTRFNANVEVRRLALNMEQVEEFDPPPNPAKQDDSRFREYSRLYGDESWELDALDPDVLVGLVEAAISGICDDAAMEETKSRQQEAKDRLAKLAEEWEE